MMTTTLIIGNKRYSSWSLRPWLLMRMFDIPFEEVLIPFEDDFYDKVKKYNPAGKVPTLLCDHGPVWDTMSIIEHLVETHADKAIWPTDPKARVMARSVANEMHSGFFGLRNDFGMDVKADLPEKQPEGDAATDVARFEEIIKTCRAQFGDGGPMLFGAFSAADAMYAPVVFRLETFKVRVNDETRAYMDAVLALQPMQEWRDAGKIETYGYLWD